MVVYQVEHKNLRGEPCPANQAWCVDFLSPSDDDTYMALRGWADRLDTHWECHAVGGEDFDLPDLKSVLAWGLRKFGPAELQLDPLETEE